MSDLAHGLHLDAVVIRCLHKDGNYRWLSWTAYADGANEKIFAIARDISEQLDLERQIVEVSAREQERIAQDLHDGLGQTLTGLAIKAKLLNEAMQQGAKIPDAEVRQIISMANHASDQARAIARGMDPIVLQEGLGAALQDLADSTREAFSIKCAFFEQPSLPPCDKRKASHLYRIAQEAVNNAVRHAKPQNILIRIYQHGDSWFLSISDDGIGLPLHESISNGMGLRNMKYRARMIGATLEFSDNKDGGATVLCKLFRPVVMTHHEVPNGGA